MNDVSRATFDPRRGGMIPGMSRFSESELGGGV